MREVAAVSNLRRCNDNDKSKAGLRGTPLPTFVTKNFTLLSNRRFEFLWRKERVRKKKQKCLHALEIYRPINQGREMRLDSFLPFFIFNLSLDTSVEVLTVKISHNRAHAVLVFPEGSDVRRVIKTQACNRIMNEGDRKL